MPTADADTLMRQASMTASTYMYEAIEAIDSRFGEGFAKGHTDLLVGFMQTASVDYGASIIAKQVEELARAIEGQSCYDDRHLTKAVGHVSTSLGEVAEAIWEAANA